MFTQIAPATARQPPRYEAAIPKTQGSAAALSKHPQHALACLASGVSFLFFSETIW